MRKCDQAVRYCFRGILLTYILFLLENILLESQSLVYLIRCACQNGGTGTDQGTLTDGAPIYAIEALTSEAIVTIGDLVCGVTTLGRYKMFQNRTKN